ncbi:MAG: methionyl-tRNA formyltransferase [Methylovirgula sp.]
MRIIFMGTPEFSVPVLEEIIGQGHEVMAVYTRAPKPAGRRGLEMLPSPVHAAAERLGLRVLTPKSLKSAEETATFAGFEADVAVVVAYGLILPKAILEATRLGCLNLHASLLPRWRGAAPIQRAVMAGDAETGIMVMRMEEGLDTGPVALVEKTAIGLETTAGELHDRLSRLGADLIGRALAALGRGTLVFTPQVEDGVTYAHKIDKAEARIDWSKPAAELHNLVRGLSPFPGAYFEADLGKGPERIKVLRSQPIEGRGTPGTVCDEALGVACGEGVLSLLTVQRAGKAPMTAAEFWRGTRINPGTFLGSLSE